MSVSKQKCLKVLQSLQNPNRSHYFKISNIDKCVSVAVPTDKSLLIYVVIDEITRKYPELIFRLTAIHHEEQRNSFDVGVDRLSIHKCLPVDKGDNEELLTLMLDRTVSPLAEYAVNHRIYKNLRWSPAGADNFQRSALAVVTADHRVEIFSLESRFTSLNKVVDLGAQFCEAMNAENFTMINNRLEKLKQGDQQYRTLVERSYALAAVDLVWSDIWLEHGDVTCCLLVVAMKSGHLVLWKTTMPISQGSFELLELVDTGTAAPACLHMINLDTKCILIVGCNDGTVKSFTIVKSVDEVELLPNTTLWPDDDSISCDAIQWNPKVNVLMLAKGVHFVVMHLDICSETINVVNQCVSVMSANSNVTDICCGDLSTFVSLLNGSIFTAEITTDPELSVSFTELLLERKNRDIKWRCHSIALSSNQVYLVESCSPNQTYDHLVLKNPHQINFYQVREIESLYEHIANLPDGSSLYDIKDVLGCIRCHYSQSKPQQFLEPLRSWIRDKQTWPTQSLLRLKLIRYFHMTQAQEKANDETVNQTDIEMDRLFLEELILVHHTSARLYHFVKVAANVTLTVQDKISLMLMVKFLRSRSIQNDVVQQSLNLLSSGQQLPAVLEKCAVCDADIETMQVMGDSCPNAHKIARCCHTLLLCDDTPYRVCSCCHAIARRKSHDAASDGLGLTSDDHCLFCDGLMFEKG